MQLGEEGRGQIHILVGLFQWGAHTHGKVYRNFTRVGKSTQILGDINSPGGACVCLKSRPGGLRSEHSLWWKLHRLALDLLVETQDALVHEWTLGRG